MLQTCTQGTDKIMYCKTMILFFTVNISTAARFDMVSSDSSQPLQSTGKSLHVLCRIPLITICIVVSINSFQVIITSTGVLYKLAFTKLLKIKHNFFCLKSYNIELQLNNYYKKLVLRT